MKLPILFALLATFSLNGFAETSTQIFGEDAEKLFNSLPDDLEEAHVGATLKRTLETECSIGVNGRGRGAHYTCEMRKIDGNIIHFGRGTEDAKALYSALPNDLRENHPGGSVKKAAKLSCSSALVSMSQLKFTCVIYR
jgi:hypothetical protein